MAFPVSSEKTDRILWSTFHCFIKFWREDSRQIQTTARIQLTSIFLAKVNHLSKVEEGVCAYVQQTLEIYRLYEQFDMTQANLPSPVLSLMKNRKGTGAATEKSGTQVHMMGAGGRTGDISNTDTSFGLEG